MIDHELAGLRLGAAPAGGALLRVLPCLHLPLPVPIPRLTGARPKVRQGEAPQAAIALADAQAQGTAARLQASTAGASRCRAARPACPAHLYTLVNRSCCRCTSSMTLRKASSCGQVARAA